MPALETHPEPADSLAPTPPPASAAARLLPNHPWQLLLWQHQTTPEPPSESQDLRQQEPGPAGQQTCGEPRELPAPALPTPRPRGSHPQPRSVAAPTAAQRAARLDLGRKSGQGSWRLYRSPADRRWSTDWSLPVLTRSLSSVFCSVFPPFVVRGPEPHSSGHRLGGA